MCIHRLALHTAMKNTVKENEGGFRMLNVPGERDNGKFLLGNKPEPETQQVAVPPKCNIIQRHSENRKTVMVKCNGCVLNY